LKKNFHTCSQSPDWEQKKITIKQTKTQIMKKFISDSLLSVIFISNSLFAKWTLQPSGTIALLKSVSAISDQIC